MVSLGRTLELALDYACSVPGQIGSGRIDDCGAGVSFAGFSLVPFAFGFRANTKWRWLRRRTRKRLRRRRR